MNTYLDLKNIEALFGPIEMGIIIDRLGSKFGDDILVAKESLIRLIVHTLKSSIKFPYKHGIQPSGTYGDFADFISNMKDCSIITFNYDITV